MSDKSYYYYINGRTIKDEDFVSVNPKVQEVYDDDGEIIYDLKQYTWKEVDTYPAFYLFAFSNGMYYAGSTKNMLSRLTQHYNDFNSFAKTDWHKKVGDIIRERQSSYGRGKGFKYSFCCCTKIFIQYTSSLKVAEELEKRWLQNIKTEKKDFLYYNTLFYTGRNEERVSSKTTDSFKIQKEAEKIFKGRKVFDNVSFEKNELTPEEKEILQLINEKVEKMPKAGMIEISISKIRWDYVAVAKDAHLVAKYLLQQLMLPNVTSSVPEIKSARYRNEGPFNLKDIYIFIDGNTDIIYAEKNPHELKYIVSSLPTSAGVYTLTFPNGKQYIGSSNNIQRRVREHLRGIFCKCIGYTEADFKNTKYPEWYRECLRELGRNKSVKQVKIDFFETEDYKIKEEEKIKQYPISQLYNTQKRV